MHRGPMAEEVAQIGRGHFGPLQCICSAASQRVEREIAKASVSCGLGALMRFAKALRLDCRRKPRVYYIPVAVLMAKQM